MSATEITVYLAVAGGTFVVGAAVALWRTLFRLEQPLQDDDVLGIFLAIVAASVFWPMTAVVLAIGTGYFGCELIARWGNARMARRQEAKADPIDLGSVVPMPKREAQ